MSAKHTLLTAIVNEHEIIHEDMARAAKVAGGSVHLVPVAEREAFGERIEANLRNIIDLLGERGSTTLVHMATELAEVILDGPHEEDTHGRLANAAVDLLEATGHASGIFPAPKGRMTQDLGPI